MENRDDTIITEKENKVLICVNGTPEEDIKENEAETIFEEIKAKNFPKATDLRCVKKKTIPRQK